FSRCARSKSAWTISRKVRGVCGRYAIPTNPSYPIETFPLPPFCLNCSTACKRPCTKAGEHTHRSLAGGVLFMTREQRLALDALEAYCTTVKRLRDLRKASPKTPVPIAHILFALFAVPDDFVRLGDLVQLDFRRQIRTLKAH